MHPASTRSRVLVGRTSHVNRTLVFVASFLIIWPLVFFAMATPSRVLAAGGLGADSTITATDPTPSVDTGSTTVVVQAAAGSGPISTGGDLVELFDNGSGPLTPTDNSDGSYTLIVSDTAVASHTISGTINGETITTGDAVVEFQVGDLAAITISPSTATISADVTQAYTAEGFDQHGNSRGNVTGATTFSIDGSGACLAATCGSHHAQTGYTVTGNNGGFQDQATLDVTPGALATMVVSPNPKTITADDTQTYGAEGFDAWGNSRGAETGTVFSITAPGTCASSICGSHLVQSGYTVTGTKGAVHGDATLDVTHGAATQLAVTTEPSATYTADASFTIVVTVEDQYGNVVNDGAHSADTISLTLGGGATSLFDGSPSAAAINGVATFSGLAVRKVGVGYAFTAHDLPLAAGSSTTFAITHGLPTQLAFTSQPASTYTADDTITTTVTVQDAYGNTVNDGAGSNATVGLTLSGGVGATLGGTVSVGATNGVAIFSNLNVRKVGSGYQLHATSTPAYTAATSTSFAITPGALHHFIWSSIGTQTAGVQFTPAPQVTAYDQWANVKTNYGGSATFTTSLTASPSGSTPSASLSWSLGVGTATVTAKRADLTGSQWVKVTDGSATGGQSGSFTVHPNVVQNLAFADASESFNGQPIDTKLNTPIYSVCVPSGGSTPCATVANGSTAVKVLARDVYGNRVLPTAITLSMATAGTGSGFGSVNTNNGVADFGNSPKITTLGLAQLRAASGAVTPAISNEFVVAIDLKACDAGFCDGSGTSGNQKGYNQITTGNDFYNPGVTNVILRTQFLTSTAFSNASGGCGTQALVGQGQEAQSEGAGLATTAPATTMLIVISKDVLKSAGLTSRNVQSFNMCVGATWIAAGEATAWTAKKPVGNGTQPAVLNGGVYWGLALDCSALPAGSANPCIALRTKQAINVQNYFHWTAKQTALYVKDSDLAFIVRKNSPWDGKAGIYK